MDRTHVSALRGPRALSRGCAELSPRNPPENRVGRGSERSDRSSRPDACRRPSSALGSPRAPIAMATKWQRGVTPQELGPEYHPALSAQMGRGAFSPIALSTCLAVRPPLPDLAQPVLRQNSVWQRGASSSARRPGCTGNRTVRKPERITPCRLRSLRETPTYGGGRGATAYPPRGGLATQRRLSDCKHWGVGAPGGTRTPGIRLRRRRPWPVPART